MGSATPPVDVSAKDPAWDCKNCTVRHHPDASCPPPGRWLVADVDIVKKRGH